jgi:serine/threonine protein kinase
MPTRRFRLPRIARFGEFELDLRAGELRRGTERIRLQEQPFRILAMLLEHPGEVVLRDEIRKRLWPNDTIVEIGHGINAAVLRLREALGESAENPRFIQTLPRRGYRFNGQVEWEIGPPLTVSGASLPGTPGPSESLAGQTLSHYRVLHKLGTGGMGVVYRAEDLQLGRHVALKFLTREFAQDPAARQLFQKEARAASALNHPNVCTVYSVEECEGQPFICMELVEGETLSALLARGPLPGPQARELALQVAAALEAAHRKGVVHRDLKPGNLMVTDCGVKVLDFGIAKLDRPAAHGPATQRGDIMGTPQYMSPEQLQGSETDARSDIFAFGLVLYEMLTGRPVPADRKSITAAALPPQFQLMDNRCLAERPEDRWQTAAELKSELERLASPSPLLMLPADPPPLRRSPKWPRAKYVLTAAALLSAGLLIAKLPIWRHTRPAPVQFTLTGPMEEKAIRPMISPDGTKVAFVSGTHHYLRAFDQSDSQLLYLPDGVGTPFWAPDGRSLAVADGSRLVKVGLSQGSMPNILAPVNTNVQGAWNSGDVILIGMVHDGIYRIPASGGTPTRLTVPDSARGETRHLLPQFLPGGRRFLYVAGSQIPGESALWAGSLDSAERTRVMPVQSSYVFVPFTPGEKQGYLLFLRDGVLVAQAFDSVNLTSIGQPYALAPSVSTAMAIGTKVSNGDFSATPTVLVYRSGNTTTVIKNWMSMVGQAVLPAGS